MAERDIKISISTKADTTGAKEAQGALKDVSTAAAATAAPIGAQAAAMKKAAEATEELDKGLAQISNSLKEVAQSGDEANEQGAELDENVNNIARAQKAQALAGLATAVGEIGAKFKEAADEVEEFDAEAAASLRKTGERIEEVTGAVTALALGFAVGGPIGAAVAGLALSVNVLVNVFKETEVAAIRAGAAQSAAMQKVQEATRNATAAETERKAALAAGEVLGALSAELEGLKGVTAELQTQLDLVRERRELENEVLQAEDEADIAEVDEEEASGKITPKEAAEKRAEIEAGAKKRARETRKTEAIEDANLAIKDAQVKITAQETAQVAYDKAEGMRQDADKAATGLAEYAGKEIPKMVRNPDTGELSETDSKFAADIGKEIETARNVLKITTGAANDAKATLDTAKQETTGANANAESKTTRAKDIVDSVNRIGEADTRGGESRAKVRDIGEERRLDADKKKNRIQSLRDSRDESEERLDTIASANRSRIEKSPRGKQDSGLRDLAKEIGNADTQAEIDAVKEAIKAKSGELGEAVVSALHEMVSQQQKVVKEIWGIKKRLKQGGL